MSDIVRVAAKVRAFRNEHPIAEYAIVTDFTEDDVDGTARVIGHCRVMKLDTGQVVAEAFGTRALRAPKPGEQGHKDTRDPDRAMTQAVGRALGLCGYSDGDSLEGDTDEDDESGSTEAASRGSRGARVCEVCGKTMSGTPEILGPGRYAHRSCLKKDEAQVPPGEEPF